MSASHAPARRAVAPRARPGNFSLRGARARAGPRAFGLGERIRSIHRFPYPLPQHAGTQWVRFRAYDAAGNWTDTIRLAKREETPPDPPGGYRWTIPGGVRFAMVPFWPRSAGDYDPRGVFWHKRPNENDDRIFRITPPADTTLVFESRRPAVPITAAERDSAIAALREQGAPDLDWSKIPAEKPIVQSLFVDESGRVWVRVTTPDTLITYDVYLPDGRYDGTAVTSLNIPVWWEPLVRGDLFYTLVTDELDVQYVVRARIRRLEE